MSATERLARVRARMDDLGVEALLLSHGADMAWLCGYQAMPLERLTMLVVPAESELTLVVPALEAPRVAENPALFALRPWLETEDPVAIVAELSGARRHLAVSDRTWASALVALQAALPTARWRVASEVTSPLRSVKDADELAALRAAGAAADRVADALLGGDLALVGRTEAEVSAELGARLVAEGHHRVNFAIVGSGPNASSPHHDAGQRRIGRGEVVVCDFGGSLCLDGSVGYCSDITRTVVTGPPPAELTELYAVLEEAQAAAVRAATVGTPYEAVDAEARSRISDAGYGELFVHRTGHGIGVEEHEDPYIVAGNVETIAEGNAFSVEPGIYLPGRFGARIEDIVLAGANGPEPLNRVDHGLAVVEA